VAGHPREAVGVGDPDRGLADLIAEIAGALNDIGYTIPPTDEGRNWSVATGRAAAANLVAVAEGLRARPMSAPPG
jgi:hypothetical protein